MFYLVCKALPLPPKFTRANKEVRKATFLQMSICRNFVSSHKVKKKKYTSIIVAFFCQRLLGAKSQK